MTTPRPTTQLAQAGQSLWIDNITRTMLDNGTLRRYIDELSCTGLTSNPTIFEKAIAAGDAYAAPMQRLVQRGRGGEELFFDLAIDDLTRAADLFRPVFDRTGGVDGYVSLEVSPKLANDTAATVAQAKALFTRAGRANLFIKVPGTREGIPAIEALIAEGVPINVTLLFSREQYLTAAEAYMRGLERRKGAGKDLRVSSVASVFVSRWDKATAKKLPADLANQVGLATSGRTYRAYTDLLASPRWKALAAAGARPQRLLWASTSAKDPSLADTFYISALAAPNTVNTMPEETLLAFADHGKVTGVMDTTGAAAEAQLKRIAAAGINVDALGEQLQIEGRDSFIASWNGLLAGIEKRGATLAGAKG